MVLTFLCLILLSEQPPNYESVLWSFKTGQEFFIEETQRHLLQVKAPLTVSTYLDYTYLWRYFVSTEKNGQFQIQATLEKVRVNNPNEAGAKACEAFKQHEGTKSTWLLIRKDDGWVAESVMNNVPEKHAVPYFLTLGTAKLTDDKDSWKQLWKVHVTEGKDAHLELNITIKQRINDRLLTNVKTRMVMPSSNTDGLKMTFEPNGSTLLGLGEFDFNRNRWNYFEYRVEGVWNASRSGVTTLMKQNSYCSYRLFERRPMFP